MRFRLSVLALVLAALSAPPALAQTADFAALDRALAAGQWQEAEAIAAQLDREAGQGDIMAAYAGAVRHAETGQCAEAVLLADLVIQYAPMFVPAYVVSYRCHDALGSGELAVSRLETLQALLPAGPERDAARQLLQSRRQAQGQPVFSGYANIVPSTNVNRQTGSSEIDGGPLGVGHIPESARGQKGVLFQFGGSVAYPLMQSGTTDLSGVLRTDIRYSTADRSFEPGFTVELPASFTLGGGSRVVIAPYASVGFEDDALVRREAGLRGTVSLPITAQQRLAVSLKLAGVDRPLRPERSGLVADGAVSLATSLAPNVNFTAIARAVYHHTSEETLRTLELTGTARFDVLVDSGLLLGAEASVGQRYHWRPAPFSLDGDQRDLFVSARADASHRALAIGPFMPSVYYEYTRSWSDNVFYDYDSHDIGLTLRASF
ncbi:tetratricopeptide repeat protein [Pelagibacterium lacus]|uniref:tetratricopeptide repeat protein n=1 Tax=Pelagibacterium lacus TaxID=2282655 RepID=UPI0011C0726D|nr:surface lipoprotein assembly modifier [Pelagibacterium lacus]